MPPFYIFMNGDGCDVIFMNGDGCFKMKLLERVEAVCRIQTH